METVQDLSPEHKLVLLLCTYVHCMVVQTKCSVSRFQQTAMAPVSCMLLLHQLYMSHLTEAIPQVLPVAMNSIKYKYVSDQSKVLREKQEHETT